MDKTQGDIFVDKDLRPAYYDDFHCLAQDCKLSCCKGWSIPFNKKDYLSLKRQTCSPELESRMDQALRRIRKGRLAETFYGEFDMSSGVCPLLQEDGLCALQREKGHAALPYVCRSYPRSEAYQTSGYLERSLSTSCEGVLKLLWELPDGIDFRSDTLPKRGQKRFQHSGGPLSLRFGEIREWCVDLLQNRHFSLPERIMLMGMGLQRLTEGEDIETWLPWARALPNSIVPDSLLSAPGEKALIMFLTDMKGILGPVPDKEKIKITIQRAGSDHKETQGIYWPNRLTHLQRATLELLGDWESVKIQPYRDAQIRYERQFHDHPYFMENLMVNIFLYEGFPYTASAEEMWKSYVNFCNLYACHRFAAVLSCREGVEDCKRELFDLLVQTSRSLLHNHQRQNTLRDDLFQHDSATLAHMAVLLSG